VFVLVAHVLCVICKVIYAFLQGISIACYAEPCICYDPFVRPSICPSVTCWHYVKTTQARIMISSPTDSPRTLVFVIKSTSRKLEGFTLSKDIK